MTLADFLQSLASFDTSYFLGLKMD